jgi:hypothetical protein
MVVVSISAEEEDPRQSRAHRSILGALNLESRPSSSHEHRLQPHVPAGGRLVPPFGSAHWNACRASGLRPALEDEQHCG